MINYSIQSQIIVEKLSVKILEDFCLGKQILILVSKTIKKDFDLLPLLMEYGKEKQIYIFDHIRPDAPFDDLDRIINQLNNDEIILDSIIAIGGGSVMDAAKVLSVSFSGNDYKDVFYKKVSIPTKKIKVLAVPTTAGTGAELSFGAIIYDNVKKVKGGLRGEIIQPDYVLIDINFYNGAPFKLKAEVGFDCLTHAIETYISRKSNLITKNQSISCIQNVFNYLIPACNNDIKAMEKIAISSALMGINLAYSSTCLPHRIQYIIGPMTQTSHAQGLIALYKGWLYNLVEIDSKELNELVADLGMSKFEFIDKINFLKKELNIQYSLSSLGIKERQIEEISRNVTGNVTADPSYENQNTIIKILKNSL